MKSFYFILYLLLTSYVLKAQTPCRPGSFMIVYNLHDDLSPNPEMDSIIAMHPDFVIDNTPGGFWHGKTLPSVYAPYGIKIYSYVHGSYESYDSATLISEIDAVALDGAEGVFLDEVSNSLDAHKKAYLLAMINEAHAKGMKIILNPGTSTFDTFLINRADLVMTDEHYSTRPMSIYEAVNPSKVIVVNEGVTSAAAAAVVTDSARNKNYGYSYACTDYLHIPSWIRDYTSLITYPTPTPSVLLSGSTVYSSTTYGNQWYSTTTGIIPGATGQSYSLPSPGSYYDIVTQAGCPSGNSDTLTLLPLGITVKSTGGEYLIYPNPANDELHIDKAEGSKANVYDVMGRILIEKNLAIQKEVISLKNIPQGLYFVEIIRATGKEVIKFIRQ